MEGGKGVCVYVMSRTIQSRDKDGEIHTQQFTFYFAGALWCDSSNSSIVVYRLEGVLLDPRLRWAGGLHFEGGGGIGGNEL